MLIGIYHKPPNVLFTKIMPKKIPPVMGYPVRDELIHYSDDLERSNSEADARGYEIDTLNEANKRLLPILAGVIDRINEGVCASKKQLQVIAEGFHDLPLPSFNDSDVDNCLDKATVVHLSLLINSFRLDCENCLNENCEMREPPVSQHKSLEGLLSVRAECSLQNANLRTLGDLSQYSAEELLKFTNFGQKSLREVKDLLAEHGLKLKDEVEEFASDMKPLIDLLSHQVRSYLRDSGIRSLEQLLRTPDKDFQDLRIPRNGLRAIKSALDRLGLEKTN